MPRRYLIQGLTVFLLLVVAGIFAAVGALHLDNRADAASPEISASNPNACGKTEFVPVTVAFDSAWASVFGHDSARRALSIMASSSAIYAPDCFQFQVVQTMQWDPSTPPTSIRHLDGEVASGLPYFRGRFLIYFSGEQFRGNTDGLGGGTHAVVEYHPGHPFLDTVVTAHELGHLLGFNHNKPPCGCLMDPSGAHTKLSPLHAKELIEASQSEGNPLSALQALAHTSGN